MASELMERKRKERYARLRADRPDLFQRAVDIASAAQIRGAKLTVAAQIEQAVVDLVLSVLDEKDPA